MTQYPRQFDFIPLWLQPEAPGSAPRLALDPGETGILLHDDNLGDHEDVLLQLPQPSFILFDMPGEAEAAAEALKATQPADINPAVASRTPNGEGLLMFFGEARFNINKADFPILDRRTSLGFHLPIYGSWVLQGCECDTALGMPQADRVDLAKVVCDKIEAIGNPEVVRALQFQLQSLPGAAVGLPMLDMNDLAEDIEMRREVDPHRLQAVLCRYADSIDASDAVDALARHLLAVFPDNFRQKLHADEPML